MAFKNSMKTYAEAVRGNVSFSVDNEFADHLQTQSEAEALILALENSFQTQVC